MYVRGNCSVIQYEKVKGGIDLEVEVWAGDKPRMFLNALLSVLCLMSKESH